MNVNIKGEYAKSNLPYVDNTPFDMHVIEPISANFAQKKTQKLNILNYLSR